MSQTYFFYDLETSGLSARDDRIMQFAGIRTDMNLQPVGKPINVMVKLSDDILPSPDAIVVTGITPQETLADGLSERELCQLLNTEVFTPNTITVGFNSVRFDDEFIRHTLWRNFYDPYEWAWSEGRSRWDMLDVVRLTRALRPEGIEWPVDGTGKAVNKLELLAKENKLIHTKAHDALSDVEALIGVANLIKTKQPKLYEYLLTMRSKKSVAHLVSLDDSKPFVYASGRYDVAYEKTTVAFPIAPGAKPGSVLVYDLRHDPKPFLDASPKALHALLSADREARVQDDFVPLPVKELSYNKCPAVAPVGVLDDDSKKRLSIDMNVIQANLTQLSQNPTFGSVVREAYEMREPYVSNSDVEHKLYDGFIEAKDKGRMSVVRESNGAQLADFNPDFSDERLTELLLRYKARQFPETLSEAEYELWQTYKKQKITAQLPNYLARLQKLAASGTDSYLLEELQLWAESIIPEED